MKEGARIAEANAQEAKWQTRVANKNPFDGLVYNDDGSRQFTDKQVVGGVNNYHQHRANSRVRAREDPDDDGDDSTLQEKDAKNAELKEAKEQSENFEKKRVEQENKEKWAKKLNIFDGTYHMEDGSRVFSPDGPVVDGANNYHQHRVKARKSHKKHNRKMKAEDDEIKEANDDELKQFKEGA